MSEWITWPLEARRRVLQLDAQWSRIMDHLPHVPEDVNDRARAEFQQYSDWREGITGLVWAWTIVDELEEYTHRANVVAAEVQQASGGPAIAPLPDWGKKFGGGRGAELGVVLVLGLALGALIALGMREEVGAR